MQSRVDPMDHALMPYLPAFTLHAASSCRVLALVTRQDAVSSSGPQLHVPRLLAVPAGFALEDPAGIPQRPRGFFMPLSPLLAVAAFPSYA